MKKERRRSANRFGAIAAIAVGAGLMLGSFWGLEVMRKVIDDTTPQVQRVEPDYYVDDFNLVRLSKANQAQYNISGKKLTHNPADDTHSVVLPLVHSIGMERPPMTSRAERALMDNNNSKVHMYENVHIDRPATPKTSKFHLASEYLLVLPDDDVMQTDRRVHITLGTATLTGTGMYANNATRQLYLSSNVHATFQPPPRDTR